MRPTQQIHQTKKHRFTAYSGLLIIFLFISWYFNLLFISRPVSTHAQILGATTPSIVNNYQLNPYPTLTTKAEPRNLARYWILIDAESGKTIVSKDASNIIPIASTAKIMTALIVLQEVKDLSQKVKIQKEINNIYQSQQRLLWGEEYSVENLLYLLLLESDNQAANSLAYFTAGLNKSNLVDWKNRIQTFVDQMNGEAAKIGLTKTKFLEPAGLDELTTSTVLEMALLTRVALRNLTFQKFVSAATKTINNTIGSRVFDLKNSNRLVGEWNYPGALGVKTGFLPNSGSNQLSAGHCLIAAAKRDNHTLIAAVYNTYSEDATSSATAAKELLDFGFENIAWY